VTKHVHSGDYLACLIGYEGDSSGPLRSLLVSGTMIGADALHAGNQVTALLLLPVCVCRRHCAVLLCARQYALCKCARCKRLVQTARES
jgi:hypothetical protein